MVLGGAMAVMQRRRALLLQALLAAGLVCTSCGVATSALLLNETKAPTALKTLVCATRMSTGAVHRANELSCKVKLSKSRTILDLSLHAFFWSEYSARRRQTNECSATGTRPRFAKQRQQHRIWA